MKLLILKKMNDLIDNELDNKDIEINNDANNNINENVGSENRDSKATSVTSQNPSEMKNINNIIRGITQGANLEEAVAKEVTEKAKEQVYKSWIDRYLCCFNWLKKYFQIKSKDFVARIIQSIIPFNSKFYDLISSNPDFYGPFWIYTCFVILVSSCGALTRTIQGKRDSNFYQEFIPTASILIYFIGFGVPILIALLSKIFGGKINIAPVICVYGYSYTIFLPITIICSIPSQLLQWIFLGYAILSSSSLIIMSISKSISEITKGKKIAIVIIIIIFQLIIFGVLKFYFFKHLNKKLEEEEVNEVVETILESTTFVNNTNTTFINVTNISNVTKLS